MNTDKQKRNWLIDAVLFGGFLAAMCLDLTGVGWHQWLGIGLIGLVTYHLLAHWQWVVPVSKRLFRGLRGQSRRYWALDGLLLVGFGAIGLTGLVISTWLNLPLGNYAVWRDAHVTASVATLAAVVLKIGMHWRWIVNVATHKIFSPAAVPTSPALGQPAVVPVPVRMGRRDFLLLMGVTGGSALLATAGVLVGAGSGEAALASNGSTSTSSGPTSTATPTAQAKISQSAVQQSSSSSSCMVRCGKHCSYPGHCRRYSDSNGNGYCDQGECSA